jgi:hypothetical protein
MTVSSHSNINKLKEDIETFSLHQKCKKNLIIKINNLEKQKKYLIKIFDSEKNISRKSNYIKKFNEINFLIKEDKFIINLLEEEINKISEEINNFDLF